MSVESSSYSYPFQSVTCYAKLSENGEVMHDWKWSGPAGVRRSGYRSAGRVNPPDLSGFRSPSPLDGGRVEEKAGWVSTQAKEQWWALESGSWKSVWTTLDESALAYTISGMCPEAITWAVDNTGVYSGTFTGSQLYQRAMARNRVLGKIRDRYLSCLVDLLQRKMTADMIFKDGAHALSDRVDDVVRRSKRDKRYATWRGTRKDAVSRKARRDRNRATRATQRKLGKSVDDVAQYWAAMRWGVGPLIGSLDGAMRALGEDAIKRAFGRSHVTAAVKGLTQTKQWETLGSTSVYRLPNYRVVVKGELSYDYMIRVDFRVVNDLGRSIDQLGIADVAFAGWDCLYLSFVVDWFLTVGDYLEALMPLMGVEIIGVSETDHWVTDLVGLVQQEPFNGTEYWAGNAWSWRYKLTGITGGEAASYKKSAFIRQVSSELPGALILPKNPVSWAHLADALALLRVSKDKLGKLGYLG